MSSSKAIVAIEDVASTGPDDFAYYLLKDNKTLVMISAVKSLKANFKAAMVIRCDGHKMFVGLLQEFSRTFIEILGCCRNILEISMTFPENPWIIGKPCHHGTGSA